MKKLKISVIGTGHLGNIHAKLWKGNDAAELVGIYDTDLSRAETVSKEYGVRAFSSLEETCAESEAVTIAAPTLAHHEIALKCIEKGIHCLIEKPITDSYSQAVEVIKLAKAKNALVQVGHVERFNPALASLKGYIKDPAFIEAHRLSQFKPRAIDVSVIHDLMIHDIDIVLWMVRSEIEKIDANGVALITDTPDIANARLTFKNGAVANLTASRISANPMRKLRVFQPNAYISIDFGKPDVEVFRMTDADNPEEAGIIGESSIPATMLGTIEAGSKNKSIMFEKPQIPKINAIAEEQTAFANSIINNKPAAVSAEEASEALRIAELIAEQVG